MSDVSFDVGVFGTRLLFVNLLSRAYQLEFIVAAETPAKFQRDWTIVNTYLNPSSNGVKYLDAWPQQTQQTVLPCTLFWSVLYLKHVWNSLAETRGHAATMFSGKYIC